MEVSLNMEDIAEHPGHQPQQEPKPQLDGVGDTGTVDDGEPDPMVSNKRRKPRKRARTSWVFSYFSHELCNNRMSCRVNDCERTYSKNTSTSSLANHLKSSHKLTEADIDMDPALRSRALDTMVNYSLADVSSEANERYEDQPSGENFQSLLQFIVDQNLPFEIVENPSFRNFVGILNKDFAVPSCRALVRGLHGEYELGQQEFRKLLASIPGKVSLTYDSWSSKIVRGYFIITLHWIDADWNLQQAILEFKYFPLPSSEAATSALILRVLKKYELGSKIRAITSNNANDVPGAMMCVAETLNQESGLKLESNWHIRCVCHIMENALRDCDRVFKGELDKVRTLVRTVAHSSEIQMEFKRIQAELGQSLDLIEWSQLERQDRWISMFKLIDVCYGQRDAFTSLGSIRRFQERIDILNNVEWREVKALRDFLAPAVELLATGDGSEYSMLALQPLIYESLVIHCRATIDSTSRPTTARTKQAAQAVLAQLEMYRDHLNSNLAMLALTLDPSTHNKLDDIPRMKALIREVLQDYEVSEPVQRPSAMLLEAAKRARTGRASSHDEVDDFFEFCRIGDDSCRNAVEWWSNLCHQKRFPTLSLLARDTLMCMGSSVPLNAWDSSVKCSDVTVPPNLSHGNVEKIVKLRSWNRVLHKFDA